MNFIVRNQANISNKYIRFAKWKIRKLSRKFNDLVYSEIYIKQASVAPAVYVATVKLGVPGPDIVISAQSMELKELWADLSAKVKRQLRKQAAKRKQLNRA